MSINDGGVVADRAVGVTGLRDLRPEAEYTSLRRGWQAP